MSAQKVDSLMKAWPVAAVLRLFLLIALATACSEKVSVITIESAEANLSPVLIGVASVFMKIDNAGGRKDILTGARTDIPGAVAELHDIVDGKMVKVDAITIPADSTVSLRPARHHIMLLKLPKDVKEGFRFNLILIFKKSGERSVPMELTNFAPGRSSLLHK
ncbi:MAG: hypothetical protein A2010_03245 [Nitrospirae bacterium GWD2_57_9]|nr:MAG: hypothetical protein A2010_03245 [Nitrospirae bacterium GWD2_57_9]OGW48620.1 MAG: hypothetical protein A2078_08800 [Nitrospirae bacterium GWC2_57_9]